MSNNMNLGNAFLLVEFTASVWTARKLDKTQTDSVIAGANAKSKAAARVNKNLLAGRPELDEIASLVGDARQYVYSNTFPWNDAGQRLVATSRFLKFNQRLEDYSAQFAEKVDAFCTLYPTLITAQAMSLGTMFNRSEYPTAGTIRAKFAFNVEYLPVPQAGDLRVDVIENIQDALREKLAAAADRRAQQVVSGLEEKLVEHMQRMQDRLTTDTSDNPDLKPRRFHDTLITSTYELCDMLRDYNLSGSTKLATLCADIERAVTGVTAKELRENPAKREEVRQAATSILNKMSIL